MKAMAPRRKGWCPGTLRPMEAGDGLLVRVRASGGRLTLDQAATIAEAAAACGNGAITFSARANLHIRGVSERSLPDLQARLGAAGLIDANPEVERVRNIVASPLSDIDPAAAFDLAPSLAALEARLAEDEAFRRLPAKFSFVLDAGGRLPLGDIDADIRFEAVRQAERRMFLVYLAGDDALAIPCALNEVGKIASPLAQAFLAHTGVCEAPRMRSLVNLVGARAVFAEAGLDAHPRPRARERALLGDALGAHVFGAAIVVGAAAPFGAIEADRFKTLVERARDLGAGGLRLAPWRTVFVTGLAPRRAASFILSSAKLGFVVQSADLRLRVAACPGAPACLHAHRPLRPDATRFASLLPPGEGVVLHVSGCAKGCARPEATSATLVATEIGYDFVVAGKAADPPARGGLSSAAIEQLIVNERAALFKGGRPEA